MSDNKPVDTIQVISTEYIGKDCTLKAINYGNTAIHIIMQDNESQYLLIQMKIEQFNHLVKTLNLPI